MMISIAPAQLAAIHQDQLLRRQSLLGSKQAVLRERDVLLVLSELVLLGAPIDPAFQALANAVVAKAAITWKLPTQPRGVKPGAGVEYDPLVLTEQYFDLLDRGMDPKDCEIELATNYHLGEKQIGRIVKENSWLCGSSKAARDQRRNDPEYHGMDEINSDDGNIALSAFDKVTALKRLEAIIIGGA